MQYSLSPMDTEPQAMPRAMTRSLGDRESLGNVRNLSRSRPRSGGRHGPEVMWPGRVDRAGGRSHSSDPSRHTSDASKAIGRTHRCTSISGLPVRLEAR